jgi:hypothetical protein
LDKAADAQVIVTCAAKAPQTVEISPCDGIILKATNQTDDEVLLAEVNDVDQDALLTMTDPGTNAQAAYSASAAEFGTNVAKALQKKYIYGGAGFQHLADNQVDILGEWGQLAPGQSYVGMTDYSAKAEGHSIRIRPPSADLAEVFTITRSNGDQAFNLHADPDGAVAIDFFGPSVKRASAEKTRIGNMGLNFFGADNTEELLLVEEETPGVVSITGTDYSAKAAGASIKIRPPTATQAEVITVSTSTGDPSFQLETDPSGATSMSFENPAKANERLVINSEGIFFLDETKSDTLARITKLGNIVAKGQIAMGNNVVASSYTTALGPFNEALNETCVVLGVANKTRDYASAALSGTYNDVDGKGAVVTGGSSNQTFMQYDVISGGGNNKTYGQFCVISGGANNEAGLATKGPNADPKLDQYATVGGGSHNIASDQTTTISGGSNNTASGSKCVVGGGGSNTAGPGGSATVGGGGSNTASNGFCTIAGGAADTASGYISAIGGGANNIAAGDYSVIAGGRYNHIIQTSGNYSTIGGGGGGQYADRNVASGTAATIPGGRSNVAAANGSFAAGTAAKANHQGSMVFAAHWQATAVDSVRSGGIDQMVFRADGGMYITNDSGQAPYNTARLINTSSGAYLTTGGTWTDASDRNLKENFSTVDGSEILQKIAGLEITRWNYKSEPENITHIGPMGQDFYAAFGVGQDEKGIAALDEGGIALAAIKELYRVQQELKGKTEEISALKLQLEQANLQLSQLSAAVEAILAARNESKRGDEKLAVKQ